ncbi:hypothetical protein [Rhodovulum sulfidophilum]|uniref:hypothetical protein n=1 Tax=Rhodovulum sulfidophilum TaxID=35806 RepID=UPI0009518AE1|nr:hypothetical protein [Rhodovulum sulfidophilum]MBL3551092.1 hypothetical protein [Rhodovulum sulfidophilum]OLS49626.1 hypothetical protein BV379_15975 [Rhodovulum sulfidophilum]
MIVGTMATYPPRQRSMLATVARIAPQLDVLNVVLNQYASVPPELLSFGNVNAIRPEEDTKDTGKFLPDHRGAGWVFLLDDDIAYPETYVKDSVAAMQALGPGRLVGGYCGAVYRKPQMRQKTLSGLNRYRKELFRRRGEVRDSLKLDAGFRQAIVADELGTGVMIARPEHLPDFESVRSAQKFIDVRMARWCFEKGITQVCLPRPAGYLRALEHEESIHTGFTAKRHAAVTREIQEYALKNPRAGQPFEDGR